MPHKSRVQRTLHNWRWWIALPFLLSVSVFALLVVTPAKLISGLLSLLTAGAEAVTERLENLTHAYLTRFAKWVYRQEPERTEPATGFEQ